MTCAICWRMARGFGFAPRLIGIDAPTVKLCSKRCQDIAARLKVINPNQFEQQALQAAGQHGGAYIESIGKTDLGQFSAQEWATLVEVIVTAFQDSLRAACADDVPF